MGWVVSTPDSEDEQNDAWRTGVPQSHDQAHDLQSRHGLGPYLWILEERLPSDVWVLYECWWTYVCDWTIGWALPQGMLHALIAESGLSLDLLSCESCTVLFLAHQQTLGALPGSTVVLIDGIVIHSTHSVCRNVYELHSAPVVLL